jgi:hypothetical protein
MARQLRGGMAAFGGKIDDGLYEGITRTFFKRNVLLSGGYAFRNSFSEDLTRVLGRDGLGIIHAGISSVAAQMKYKLMGRSGTQRPPGAVDPHCRRGHLQEVHGRPVVPEVGDPAAVAAQRSHHLRRRRRRAHERQPVRLRPVVQLRRELRPHRHARQPADGLQQGPLHTPLHLRRRHREPVQRRLRTPGADGPRPRAALPGAGVPADDPGSVGQPGTGDHPPPGHHRRDRHHPPWGDRPRRRCRPAHPQPVRRRDPRAGTGSRHQGRT